jgi:hypothetical protein
MMLPEILLALLTISTLYFYLQKNKPGYLLFGILLVLTKETGIFLILIILLFEMGSFFTIRGWPKLITRQLFEMLVLFIPLLIFGIHLIVQKLTYGWFFYPEHLGYITGFRTGATHLKMFSNVLFIRHGQVILLIIFSITLLLSVFQKDKISISHKKPLLLLLLFLVGYLILSAFNFSSPRYLLSVCPVFAILCAYFLFHAMKSVAVLPYVIGLLAGGFLLYSAAHIRENGDYDMGYVNAVRLQKQTVEFCEQNNWYNTPIYCNFLMRISLTDKTSGFLSGNKTFKRIVWSPEENPDILIFNNIENDPRYSQVEGNEKYQLIQTFSSSWMWVQVYMRK